jgi:HemY protein
VSPAPSPAPPVAPPASSAPSSPAPPPSAESAPVAAAPLFRARQDIPRTTPARIPAVIPLLRAPDDPGIDDDGARDEFAEQIGPPNAQTGGWRGFLSRWGS